MRPSRFLIALPVLTALVVAAQAEDFITAKGRSVPLPDIEGMTCDEMNVTLTKIDLTRYRENAPTPHHSDDLPLFRYEKELAQVHFHACVMDTAKAEGGNDLRKSPEKQ